MLLAVRCCWQPAVRRTSPATPPPVDETVFRDMAAVPIEKAKNVEDVVMEQKRATDRAVDQNESDQ